MFKQAATYNNTTDLQEYSETVTAYITKCIDDVTVTKTITVRANQKPWLTGEVYRLLKARNAAFRAGDEEGLKTARANLSRGIREAKRQYSRRIAIVSATAETLGACGRGFRPLRTTSPHHRPVTAPSPCWTSWMPSLLALRHKTAPLHRRLHLLWRPGDDTVPGQREEIPQQDQCTQSSGSWQHSWACTERLCSGTHWCLHRHFQHLTKSGCCPHMLQSYHHHSSPEEVISILLQWLPSSSTHSYSHEVLWTASHATHQICPPPLPGPLPVCI